MEKSAVDSKYAGAVIGAVSLLSLLTINLTASATANRVWFLGNETHIGCWFKETFHAPCPVCGMTRSVILAVHGNLGEAFQMHIGGPLAVFGILIFGLAMLYSALQDKSAGSFGKKALTAITVYFGIVTFVSIVYWILRLSGYFQTLPELL